MYGWWAHSGEQKEAAWWETAAYLPTDDAAWT